MEITRNLVVEEAICAYEKQAKQLATAIVKVAISGGMPDTYWSSDSRIRLARRVLGDKAVQRMARRGGVYISFRTSGKET
jgi:hypothetical protein